MKGRSFSTQICYHIAMKIYRISFFDNFRCLSKNCPDTCCKGWIIPLDDDALSLYHSQSGLLLLRLLLTERKSDGIVCFNKNSRTCPHLTADKLCYLQKKHGEEFLCTACREYPRLYSNYKYFAKECLDLSCPVSARLFINNIDNLSYEIIEDEISYELTVTNDDENFLNSLHMWEGKICDYISENKFNLNIAFANIMNFARITQNSYTKNPSDDFLNKDFTFDITLPFNIDILTTDRIINSELFHKKIKITDPFLYKLCRLYDKKFNNLSISDGNNLLSELTKLIETYYGNIHSLLSSYCSYIIKCTYLNTYEDYSFIKNLTMPFIHTHLLAIFIFVYADKYKKLDDDDLIKIITAYDKRARHNISISDKMFNEVYRLYEKNNPTEIPEF